MKGAAEAHLLLCSSGSIWVPGIVVGSGSGSVWAPVWSSVLVLVPSGPPAWSSVLVPSGPPRGCWFWFCLSPCAVVGSGSGSVGAPRTVIPTVYFLHMWPWGLPGWMRSSGVTGVVPLSAQCRKRACSPRAGSATRSPTTLVIRTAARLHRSPRLRCRRLIPK